MSCFCFLAYLELSPSGERNEDIDCPGDKISYYCSVEIASSDAYIKWVVVLPDNEPVTITHNSSSPGNISDGPNNTISSTRSTFGRNEYLGSMLTIDMLAMDPAALNGTFINCSTEGNFDTTEVLIRNPGTYIFKCVGSFGTLNPKK